MTLEEVLAELESLGTEQNRKVYRRHSGVEPILGVSFANLYMLRKRIKRDQPLAEALWETRISEAQFLATMIADPKSFTRKDLDRWASTAIDYAISDFVAKEIAVRTPFAMDAALKWIDAKSEVVGRAGWATVGCLAISGGAPDEFFLPLLAENRTRHPQRAEPHPPVHEQRRDRYRMPRRTAPRRCDRDRPTHRQSPHRPRRDVLQNPGRRDLHRKDLRAEGSPSRGVTTAPPTLRWCASSRSMP